MPNTTVTIYEVPGRKHEVSLNGTGGDWQEALRLAGVSVDGRDVTVNGGAPSNGTAMQDGDRITLAKGAKGNMDVSS